MNHDEFRPLAGHEGYRISPSGEVQTCKVQVGNLWVIGSTWATLAHRINKPAGHHRIALSNNGRQSTFLVHRLVLLTFGPPMPFVGALALHKDDDPNNNHISNLYWGTSKQNRADAMRSGRAYIPKGEENGKAILTAEQVAAIKAFPRTYGYRNVLAARYGVSVATIKDIIAGRSWAVVECPTTAKTTYGTGQYAGRRRRG